MTARRNFHIILATITAAFGIAGHAAADCAQNHVDLRWATGAVRISVEVADDDQERAQGLMFRRELGRYAGMLFVYPRPQPVSFWMKNTNIPLDMIFLDQHGKVLGIHENAEPLSTRSISGGDGVLVVLEINGGLSGHLGLLPGAEMRHPAFDRELAAWPCPNSSQ